MCCRRNVNVALALAVVKQRNIIIIFDPDHLQVLMRLCKKNTLPDMRYHMGYHMGYHVHGPP